MLVRLDICGTLEGLVILQVDDSFAIGTNAFFKEEEVAVHNFKDKPSFNISKSPISFDGSDITLVKDGKPLQSLEREPR